MAAARRLDYWQLALRHGLLGEVDWYQFKKQELRKMNADTTSVGASRVSIP